MKKLLLAALLLALCLCGCGKEEPKDYAQEIQGIWYAVEYENEVVDFRADGTVADTYCGTTTYGDYLVDNEGTLIWCNFGDDVFSIRIQDEDGKLTLIDNNGTMVREEDLQSARAAAEG